MDPLWVSAGITFVLAGITFYYAYETMQIRRQTLLPRLSLHTGIYTDDGGVHAIKLRNTGPVARNLEVVIQWNEGTSCKEKISLFIPSLNTGEEVYLPLKLDQVKAGKGSVTVSFTLRDASNREIKDTLPPIDFAQLASKQSEISQVANPEVDALDAIRRDTKSALDSISRKIDKR